MRWRDRRPLFVDPPDAASLRALAEAAPPARFLVRDFAVLERVGGPTARIRFAAWLDLESEKEPPPGAVVLFLPKGKEPLAMGAAMSRRLLTEEGALLLAGGNKEGIKSAGKRLEGPFRKVIKVDSACHAALFAATPGQPQTAGLEGWESRWELATAAGPLAVASLPGVFSHGRLDEGSARLLEHLELPDAHGRILDLGCGAGVIGAAIARSHPESSVELVDTSALALEASRRTLELNRLENARVYPSDTFSAVRERFSAIVTNPPFHQGVTTDYRVHAELAARAADHLEPDGELLAVVNRFLPLERMLGECFHPPETLFEDGRFRVFRARRR
ncbi:hypothetical protein JCM17961_49380 [Endothiovibrio diazotrophicus]